MILNSSLTSQIYFGLSIDDEQKLFTDINTNAKRVSRSLITKFDNRDILNVLTRELYSSSKTLQTNLTIEFEKTRIVKPNNNTFITSVRLKKFIKILLFGEGGIGSRSPELNKKQEHLLLNNYDKVFSFLNKVFLFLGESFPPNPGDVREFVLGHEPVQNAIALYLHNAIITQYEDDLAWLENWEEDVEQLQNINWSVKNRTWKQYMVPSRKGTSKEYMNFNDPFSQTYNIKDDITHIIHY